MLSPEPRAIRARTLVIVLLLAAGAAAALTALFVGFWTVLHDNGGMCASGGPYAIARGHECSGSSVALLGIGIPAFIVFSLALSGVSGVAAGMRAGGTVAMLMWSSLFGSLGTGFILAGVRNIGGGAAAWWICGIVFWLMAAPALYSAVRSARSLVSSAASRAWLGTFLIGAGAGVGASLQWLPA